MVVNMSGSVVANGMRIGIISDTHGLMRPEAIAALRGSDLIVHAGDIGRLEVLEQLRDLAPTHAKRFRDYDQPLLIAGAEATGWRGCCLDFEECLGAGLIDEPASPASWARPDVGSTSENG